MNKKIYKALEEHRNKQIGEVAQHLLSDSNHEKTSSAISSIKDSSLLLDTIRKADAQDKTGVFKVGALCLAISGILWATPLSKISNLHISFNIRSNSIMLSIPDGWSFAPVFYQGELPDRPYKPYVVTELRIENLGGVIAPALGLDFEDRFSKSELFIKGEKIVLDSLKLGKNANLEILANSKYIRLFLKSKINGEFYIESRAQLGIEGTIIDTVLNFSPKISDPPEPIEFYAEGIDAAPTIITFDTKESLRFRNPPIQELKFLWEQKSTSGLPLFDSAIRTGTIMLYDVPSQHELHFQDIFSIQLAEVHRLEITANNEINVFFEGQVEKIVSGPKGFEKNLSPSLLEYLYHQAKFGFLLGSVAFLWGIFWRFKKTLLG